ncbi:hypothetical protein KAFR_0E03310 [Kazachstania africana CBS 2517]|uniref:Zn(2)-C6 fungal-type domain-containing protein n=1 Tax=Kazachstania africana (strain ATCC 22294 / BCRC 22015 / CBS 2517 / CECT 1963 / NBRC 1671 / NRRL Y-8276) TaxID=1071382 RepID=H2AVT3_KAZAF|nr:hypothetical protein KAFR_0E03310 [Kazachstania africana CBS 2517]CCF58483.1 hypothetical protein KAFR_0E03310 [Kazachstania africana CBS 2517]
MSTSPQGKSLKTESKWRRSYKACLNCRARKVKCDLGPYDNPHPPPCVRCKREQRECLFTSRRKKKDDVISGTVSLTNVPSAITQEDDNDRIQLNSGSSKGALFSNSPKNPNTQDQSKWKYGLGSMQNTLEFLATAAGSVSKESNRRLTTARHSHQYAKETSEDFRVDDSSPSSERKDITDTSEQSVIAPLLKECGTQRATVSLIEELSRVRPKPNKKLADIDYIGPSNLLSEQEARELIDAYFLTMHPFFPNIPLQLQDPDELVNYPILLCAILTMSSRYHPFSEFGFYNGENNKRNIEVHETLWDYCQRLISQTVWAEASTRSIGTVLAFIIFTEWNPRQIHWRRTDYANSAEKDTDVPHSQKDDDGLTGIGAIRRSDRMSWMLTGSAVRLAQDMGFIETSTKIFVASHISDTFASMNMNQRCALSETFSVVGFGAGRERASAIDSEQTDVDEVGNEKFYLEQMLQNEESRERWTRVLERLQHNNDKKNGPLTDLEREFLNDEYVLYYANRNDEMVQQHLQLPFPLKFSFHQRAKIELIRIILIAYDTIYYDKGKRKLTSNDQVHNLAVLGILSPLIEGWYATYRNLLKISSGQPYSIEIRKNKRAVHELGEEINRESILSDYYYCQLYIYSLALQVDVKGPKLRINEATKSAKYVELAYVAAKEILISSTRVHRLKMLKYMPVRWVMRIVRAVSFLVKCYLTLTGGGGVPNSEAQTILKLCCISLDETIHTIRLAALILKEASPDELHLCVRYSAILLYLCKEMNLKSKRNQKLLVSHGILINESRNRQMGSRRTKATQDSDIDLGSTDDSKNIQSNNELLPNNISTTNGLTTSLFNTEEMRSETPNQRIPTSAVADNTPNNLDNDGTNNPTNFPSLPDEAIDWFSGSADIGLDFVEPWTELLEQRFLQSGDGNNIFEELYNQVNMPNFAEYTSLE